LARKDRRRPSGAGGKARDIQACLVYAKEVVQSERVYAVKHCRLVHAVPRRRECSRTPFKPNFASGCFVELVAASCRMLRPSTGTKNGTIGMYRYPSWLALAGQHDLRKWIITASV
jgi:hypothetical protein